MRSARTLATLLACSLVVVTLALTASATALGDTAAPTLSGAKVRPKVLTGARKAWLKVTSSEPATLKGVVLLKQDGRWNAATQEKSWTVHAGRNVRLLYSMADLSVLRDGRYRIRLSAIDDDGDRSAKIVLSFRVDH